MDDARKTATLLSLVHLVVFGLASWWTRPFPLISRLLLVVALLGSALIVLYFPLREGHKNGEDKL